MDLSFYRGKKVLITGHTGFKGSWMCKVLLMAGADITGYSLMPPTEPSLFGVMGLFGEQTGSTEYRLERNGGVLRTVIGDICDLEGMDRVFEEAQPEIVIHLAAQPIVRESYKDPVGTYAANVMGTVHVLECVRRHESVRSFVNVTTDKVYRNREWDWGYRENEELNGYDPYSNSKSCSELVTSSYKNSFFGGGENKRENGRPVAVSTMRAGNVIGGGDFAADRIIPDCIRAVEKKEEIIVRNPYSTRPYQHVLEPVMAYLMVAEKQFEEASYAGSYNVGPDDADCYETGNIVDLFCRCWNGGYGNGAAPDCGGEAGGNKGGNRAAWKNVAEKNAPHEANFLKLDCAKLKKAFGWRPVWNLETAMEKIVEWSLLYLKDKAGCRDEIHACMEKQIQEYLKGTGSLAAGRKG